MILYLKSRRGVYNASADYDIKTKQITVKKGSLLCERISSGTFRSAKSVEKMRAISGVKDNRLTKDVPFKSASTAANFVTGTSTNGKIAWKNKEGMPLKKILENDDLEK